MLEIKNLSKKYSNKLVINNISIKLKEGTITGLFGVNGSGKSTLMKIISGLVIKDSGDILLNNNLLDINDVSAMIEEPTFYNNLSGYDNLYLLKILNNNINKEDIINALNNVGLSNKMNEKYSKYSLGMKQRLYIASCLIRNTKVLLLDEPFNGIDPISLALIEKLLIKLKDDGKIILISSHEIRELQELVDKVIFIDNGKIIYDNNKMNNENIFDLFLKYVDNSGNVEWLNIIYIY